MDKKNDKVQLIGSLGKHGLVQRVLKNFSAKNPGTLVTAGDDAAVMSYSGNHTVVSTKLMTEGIHFNFIYTPLKHLGYKCMVAGVSDVLAMNANPGQVILSLGISSKFEVSAVDELFNGIEQACETYQLDLAGLDITSTLTGMVISTTVVGEVGEKDHITRQDAGLNDLICVSGDLGAAYMGLQLLEREKKIFQSHPEVQPDLRGKEYILQRQLKPEARKDVIQWFKEAGLKPTALTDITEGLVSDLMQICKASGAGCRIYQDKIPIHAETQKMAGEFHMEPLIAALHGGEDYELLFTLPLEAYENIINVKDITVIGHITDARDGMKLETSQGTEIELKDQSWGQKE